MSLGVPALWARRPFRAGPQRRAPADLDRGRDLPVKRVADVTVTLAMPYAGDTDSGLGYSLGGKLVGEPWEVKLPPTWSKLYGSIVIG